MNSEEAWSKLGSLTGKAMTRWTASKGGRVKFSLERKERASEVIYQVITESGREPRWFNKSLFEAFWDLWLLGKQNPDGYREVGPTGGMYKLAYYLLSVATSLDPKEQTRDSEYGERSNWRLAVDAVGALGGTASIEEVSEYLKSRNPAFKTANVRPDLDLVTVNAFGRANWSPNQTPRKIDGSNPYDVLFLEEGSPRKYTFYEPKLHGVWELKEVTGDAKLRPHRVDVEGIDNELAELGKELAGKNEFDPFDENDARKKILSSIVRRQGQPEFKAALLKAYGRCAFSGCEVTQVLEGAHIRPYLGPHTNVIANGLLLRADLHTLFDLRLLRVHPVLLKIEISSRVTGDCYRHIEGRVLVLPSLISDQPSNAALRWHWIACASNFADLQTEDGGFEV